MQVLQEVCVTFPETKDFIDEKLKRKCANENIFVVEVIYFSLLCLYIGNEILSLTINYLFLALF